MARVWGGDVGDPRFKLQHAQKKIAFGRPEWIIIKLDLVVFPKCGFSQTCKRTLLLFFFSFSYCLGS